MPFHPTDQVRMKQNLRGIDTFGISPRVIRKYRRTKLRVREVHEDEYGGWLRMYGIGEDNQLRLAYWNPEMFELIPDTCRTSNKPKQLKIMQI